MENGSSCREESAHGAPRRSRPFKVKSWGRMVSVRNTKPPAVEEQELPLEKNCVFQGAADKKIEFPSISGDLVLVESIKFASRFTDHTHLITQRPSVRSASSSTLQMAYRGADITISGEE